MSDALIEAVASAIYSAHAGEPRLLRRETRAMAEAAIKVIPLGDEVTMSISELATKMRRDSEYWFPGLHSGETSAVPLFMHYSLGLIGEAGEVANVVKKMNRDGQTDAKVMDLAFELADVLIYTLLLADEMGIDITEAYDGKRRRNVARWGDPDAPAEGSAA
jgi:NTP pyrophosphatase (non-canonical NTP hydrolase)